MANLVERITKKNFNARKKTFEKTLPKDKKIEDVIAEESKKLKKYFTFLSVCIKFLADTEKLLKNKITEIEASTGQEVKIDHFLKKMWILRYTILCLVFFEIKHCENEADVIENNKLIDYVLKSVLEKEKKLNYYESIKLEFPKFIGLDEIKFVDVKNLSHTLANIIAEKIPLIVFDSTGGRLGGEQHDLIMELVMTTISKDKKFFYGDSDYKDYNLNLSNEESNGIKIAIKDLEAERNEAGKEFFNFMIKNKKEEWHNYYKEQKIKTKKKEEIMKEKNKNWTKADKIGAIGGLVIISILFAMGSFGFIPALLITYGSYWIVKKIAQFFLKEESVDMAKTMKESKEILSGKEQRDERLTRTAKALAKGLRESAKTPSRKEQREERATETAKALAKGLRESK